MRKNETIKLKLRFRFVNFGDTIHVKINREFFLTKDIDNNVRDYVEKWLDKFSSRYGECVKCKVYYKYAHILTYHICENEVYTIETNYNWF